MKLIPYSDKTSYSKKRKYIYFLMYIGELLYIGSTNHIRNRIKSHRKKYKFTHVFIIILEHSNDYLHLERKCILEFKPKYNTYYQSWTWAHFSMKVDRTEEFVSKIRKEKF